MGEGELHVIEHDGPSGVPRIVFIHGALDRHNSFRRTARRLEGHRLTLYDRRGYGRSTGADATCDFSKHVADLVRLIGSEPIVLVGHSMGALIALHAASVYPARVAAVGAFEPPAPWLGWWPTSWVPERDESDEEVVRNFHERIIGPGSWDRISTSWQRRYLEEGVALRNDLEVGVDGPLFDPVEVSAPVVVGHGTESTEHHIRAARLLADELPDAELVVIDNAAHGAHRSHPDAFADFVRSTVARAR